MNYRKYLNILLFSSSIYAFNSCTKLDEKIYSQIATESTELTDEDVKNLIAPVFSSLRSVYWGWDGLFDIYEESSDLIMTPLRIGVGWGDYYITMHKHTYNAYGSHFYGLWYNAYSGISNINSLLDKDNESLKAYHPELRAMRALFYYLLLDNFRNVPLETTTNNPAGYLPTQASPDSLFNFIVDELNAVKDDLGTDITQFGHLNKYGVDMILAKMYLNKNAWFGTNDAQNYELALAAVNDIIESQKFSLSANYTDAFRVDINNCPEVIFAIPFDFTYASGNYLSNKALHGGSAATFNLSAAPWNGSCAIPQFMDTYDQDDKRYSDTWLVGAQYDAKGSPILVNGSPMVYTKDVTSIDNPGAYALEGARFQKYEIVAGNRGTYGDDVPFFRLSDTYFIKAECLLRLGRDEQTAADLVTAVRKRSFPNAPDKATRTVAQLKGGSVYEYGHYENKSWKTKEGGADVQFGGLLDDLAWEFVGEHHRRQDLIRFTKNNGENIYLGKSWFCKDAEGSAGAYHNIFPIYQTFVDANVNMSQNPGY